MAAASSGANEKGPFAPAVIYPPGHGSDLSDKPITDEGQDLLGRRPFVDKLYEQIIQLPTPRSFVFGLYGGWGEGKTFVLNLLHRRLASNSTIIPLRFNPSRMIGRPDGYLSILYR
jgi:KAP family P-loop domain